MFDLSFMKNYTGPTIAWRLILAAALILGIWNIGYAEIDFGTPPIETDETLVEVSTALSYTSVESGHSWKAALIADIKPGWHINSSKPYQDWLIPAGLSFENPAGFQVSNITFPEAHDVPFLDENISVYSNRVVISFDLMIDADVADGEYILPMTLNYQACDDSTCRAPQSIDTELKVAVGALGAPNRPDLFDNTSVDPDRQSSGETVSSSAQTNELQELVDKYGFWGYLLALGLAFVTGLVLSFSPCTYPMIPITVSIFAGQQRSIGRGFIMSLFYVGSMAVIYGVMGLVVSMVGGVFGAWLASPPVVIGIAVIFVIFSLSMFGLYELQMPMFIRQKLGTTKTSGGIGGAIVLGAVAALVVSPCVGPFVAGILLYIATYGSPYFGFLVLFIFALGLGTLFVIIGTFSSAINSLPRAGEWMEQIKKFFGFVLLLMALYFLRTIIPVTTTAILTALLLLAFGVFGGGMDRLTSEAGGFARLKKFLGLIALLIGAYLLVGTILLEGLVLPPASKWLPVNVGSSIDRQKHEIDWVTDLETGLAKAKNERRPVLIDTWATWCANCRVLEKRTFGHPDVIREAERFVPIKVQLEKADSKITRAFMKRFGMKMYSLPTTLLLDADGNPKMIRQGLISPEEMISEMQQLK